MKKKKCVIDGKWIGCGHPVRALILDNNPLSIASYFEFDENNPNNLCIDCWEKDIKRKSWLDLPNTIKFYRTTGDYGFLSNLFKCQVVFEGKRFPTAEHAYQYGKFIDRKVADWAMQAPKPHLLCIIAHGLFPYDVVKNWNEIKVSRMKDVLTAKFTQDIAMGYELVETKDLVLIENSKSDSFWGCGKKGTGQNTLGMLLMELREKLKKGGSNT